MNNSRILLHICCAPDATVPWPELLAESWDAAGFFYGGNIHPEAEYERRADAIRRLSDLIGRGTFIQDFDTSEWDEAVKGLEREPEGGRRCEVCFSLQLDAAARFASENSFTHLSTTLTISPHKNPALINEIGGCAAARHGVEWVNRIWRKNGGFKRSAEESRKLGLYRQTYCGCVYSAAKEK